VRKVSFIGKSNSFQFELLSSIDWELKMGFLSYWSNKGGLEPSTDYRPKFGMLGFGVPTFGMSESDNSNFG